MTWFDVLDVAFTFAVCMGLVGVGYWQGRRSVREETPYRTRCPHCDATVESDQWDVALALMEMHEVIHEEEPQW